MCRSLKLLLFAVALPGALTPLLYGAFDGDDDDRRVRVRSVEAPRVNVAEPVRVPAPEVRVEVAVEQPVALPDRWREQVVVARAWAVEAQERAVDAQRQVREARVRAVEARVRTERARERTVERAVAVVRARTAEVRSTPARAATPAGAPCEVRAERSLAVAADATDLLELDAGSGELVVEGVQGAGEVRVVATLCASDDERLSGLDVSLERSGEGVRLETRYPSREGRGEDRAYARIDLRVDVPRGMAADLRDSSGAMRIAGVGPLTIDDRSGEIEVVGVDGDVRMDDGSGEIALRDVAGSVEIEDGSGEMEIRDVQGSVRLTDGSGSIEVRDVDRDVRVVRDGSGSIEVHEVGGDFVVERDGSGSIRFSGIRGRVEVPERR